MMTVTRKVLGKRLFEKLIKSTVYRQFVCGDTEEAIRDTVKRLQQHGIKSIIACTSEDDLEGKKTRKDYENCLSRVTNSIDIANMMNPSLPMVQTKISGKLPIHLLVKLGNIPVGSVDPMIKAVSEVLMGNQTTIPFDAILPSNILTATECEQLLDGICRLKTLGKVAVEKGVVILVDAEFTYINPGINILTLAMMKVFNKERPIIWNTYQCYLKTALDTVTRHVDMARNFGICFGAKIVRGAYMKQERNRAKQLGYPDPLNENFEATSAMYHRVADYMLEYIRHNPSRCSTIIASHNEGTVRYVTKRMNMLNIEKHASDVRFGQLLGMCDHVTYSLGHLGYHVYKCSTFGAVDDVLPFLYRRAMENQTVLEGTRRDVTFIQFELRNRMKFLFTFNWG